MRLRKTRTFIDASVAVHTTPGGTPEPSILVGPDGPEGRDLRATLHVLAANVEWATLGDRWLVRADPEGRRVFLELASGDPEEVERGMEVLTTVVRDSL